MRHLFALAASAIVLTGCNDNGDDAVLPAAPDEPKTTQQLLDENQTKWANASLSDYSYTYDVACFCVVEEDIVVNVRNGAVASAFFTPSGRLLSEERLSEQMTIDGLFGYIQNGIDEGYFKLEVSYDERYGFPVTIDEDRSAGIADDERFIRVGSFQ